MGILEEICDKSNITATSENILLAYCVSDCLARTGLKTDASSLCLRGQRTVLVSFSRSLKGDLFSQLRFQYMNFTSLLTSVLSFINVSCSMASFLIFPFCAPVSLP